MCNQYIEDVDKLRRRINVINTYGEIDASDKDYFIEILIMRMSLYSDLILRSPYPRHHGHMMSHATSISNFRRTILGLTTIDVGSYVEDWKFLREALTSDTIVSLCGNDGGAVWPVFKQQTRSRIHNMWILSSIEDLMVGDNWFGIVNQWIVFDSKINFRSLDLTTKCCIEYIDFEEQLHEAHINSKTITASDGDHYSNLHLVQYCARDMFGAFQINDYAFRPKHGPGASYELSRLDANQHMKNRYFRYDSDLATYLKYRLGVNWKDAFFYPYKGDVSTCQLVCVPKSPTKNRTISKEPVMLQYLQQDVRAAMDDYFNQHVADHINLHDQGRSRHLAKKGSVQGSYATIDLSAASDSVTVDTIELMFDGLPILYPLMATRSRFVNVRNADASINKTIYMRKFAPMGSATCFPTECAVFSVLCATAIRLDTGRKHGKDDFCVYGDDIVIKSEYVDTLLKLLNNWGFKVNTDKSFFNTCGTGYFREACGIECLNGIDITPLRLSRKLSSLKDTSSDRHPDIAASQIDLCNRSFLYGYESLRRLCNDALKEHWWFHRIYRICLTDYDRHVSCVSQGRKTWIHLPSQFLICPDMTDTNYRAYKRRSYDVCKSTSCGCSREQHVQFQVAVGKAQRLGALNRHQIDDANRRFWANDRSKQLSDRAFDQNDLFTWLSTYKDGSVVDTSDLDVERNFNPYGTSVQKWAKQWVYANNA